MHILNFPVLYKSSYALGGTLVKDPPASAGDIRIMDLISGLGRSLGVGNANPLQYSCLGNPRGRGAWQAAVLGVVKSQT